MNMPVYDLDSKVYLSTDIVLVEISIDAAGHKTATVQETLFGSLSVGRLLDQIDGYLSFFYKINSGDRLILFLDSRPRKLGFLYQEFEKAPYAIVPSGVELIDPFGHTHSYYQPRNPGGYYPAGYSWFPPDKPLTEEDARKFPTVSEEEQEIREAIRSVDPARGTLGHDSNAADVPRLLHFVDITSSDRSDCAIRTAAAIREDALQHIRERNDPDLLLHAETVAGDAESLRSAQEFLEPTDDLGRSEDAIRTFRAKRAEFLLGALADRNRPVDERRTALDFLLFNSAWGHPYSGFARVLPIDAPALASITSRIVEVSRSIFYDPDDDAVLRGMSLRFLDLDKPENVSLAESVYKATKSDALRFEIEDVLLSKSDKLFLGLVPSSSEGASIVGIVPRAGCTPADWPEPMFFSLYRRPGQAHVSIVLVDSSSARTIELKSTDKNYGGGISSDGTGWSQFPVEDVQGIPTGSYLIEIQFRVDGKAIGHGYGSKISVIEESGRKRVVLAPEASRERPQLRRF